MPRILLTGCFFPPLCFAILLLKEPRAQKNGQKIGGAEHAEPDRTEAQKPEDCPWDPEQNRGKEQEHRRAAHAEADTQSGKLLNKLTHGTLSPFLFIRFILKIRQTAQKTAFSGVTIVYAMAEKVNLFSLGLYKIPPKCNMKK